LAGFGFVRRITVTTNPLLFFITLKPRVVAGVVAAAGFGFVRRITVTTNPLLFFTTLKPRVK